MDDIGVIAMFPSTSIPKDWVICDGRVHNSPELEALIGSPNTPNLTDLFVRGAPTTSVGAIGGVESAVLAAANMPNHSHGGTLSAEGAHTHAATSGGMSANAAHAHSAWTGSDSANHTHGIPARNASTQSGNHTHTVQVNEGSGESSDGTYVDTNPTSQGTAVATGKTNADSAHHVHGNVTIWTWGISMNHYHAVTVGSTSIAHSHPFSVAAPNAAHTHSVGATGDSAPIALLPVHYALLFVIKAA